MYHVRINDCLLDRAGDTFFDCPYVSTLNGKYLNISFLCQLD
jgi:hypothetical protein